MAYLVSECKHMYIVVPRKNLLYKMHLKNIFSCPVCLHIAVSTHFGSLAHFNPRSSHCLTNNMIVNANIINSQMFCTPKYSKNSPPLILEKICKNSKRSRIHKRTKVIRPVNQRPLTLSIQSFFAFGHGSIFSKKKRKLESS